MRKTLATLFIACFGPASAAVITFGTASEFTNNFRAGDVAMTWGDLSGNGTMRHGGNNTTGTAIYDLDGSGAGTTTFSIPIGSSLTVTADVMVAGSGLSSVGIYFVGSNGGNLALLNPTSGNDQFRIFSGSALNGGAGSTTLLNDNTADVFSGNVFQTISATYTALTAGSYRITMTTGGKTVSQDVTATALTDIQVGFRAYNSTDSSNTVHIDNVNVVPEPGTATLAIAALAIAGFRRRR